MGLTERERQILQFIADGASTQTIATGLRLSAGTVHWYRSQAIAKLGAANGFNAVAIGLREGLIK